MIVNYIMLIIFTVADLIDSYAIVSNTADCDPNRVYKKDDVTCICSKEGKWPHQNCSVVFDTQRSSRICEPDSYVTVDCNVCRCSKTGNIDKEFCTKHNCDGYNHIRIIKRRSNSEKSKCEPNHWYALTDCRLCYCINKNNLLCNSGGIYPKKLAWSTYNLTDCGSNLLNDIHKLLSKDPLRTKRISKNNKIINAAGTEYNIPTRTTPTLKVTTNDIFSIMINRENNHEEAELSENKDKNSDDNDVDSGDEPETLPENPDNFPVFPKDKAIARLAANTAIPFENDEDDSDNYSSEKNNSDELDDIKKEPDDLDKSREGDNKLLIDNKHTTKKVQDRDRSLININIPSILEKMFNFRKSVVSLDQANCVPGSTLTVKCNTCFCLKNGKMLCTEKICD